MKVVPKKDQPDVAGGYIAIDEPEVKTVPWSPLDPDPVGPDTPVAPENPLA